MSETIMVFWLLIYAGSGQHQPPVFLPEPFETAEDCRAAGDAFKDSPLDRYEQGTWTCIPQPKRTPQ